MAIAPIYKVITEVSIYVVDPSNICDIYKISKILLCTVAKIYSKKSNCP